jgi:uncharacterized damage-inducible protein DinB
MTNFYDDLFDRLREVHADIGKAVDGCAPEALDWVPGSEMNSMAVLIAHLTGAERYWIGVAINEPPERDRDAEFLAAGLSVEQLKARINSADEYARESLKRLSLSDLEAMRVSPRNAKSFSVGWCLIHALEHSALHNGHIQLTRQLWEQKRAV